MSLVPRITSNPTSVSGDLVSDHPLASVSMTELVSSSPNASKSQPDPQSSCDGDLIGCTSVGSTIGTVPSQPDVNCIPSQTIEATASGHKSRLLKFQAS